MEIKLEVHAVVYLKAKNMNFVWLQSIKLVHLNLVNHPKPLLLNHVSVKENIFFQILSTKIFISSSKTTYQ